MPALVREGARFYDRKPKRVALLKTFTNVEDGDTVTFDMSESTLLNAFRNLKRVLVLTSITWVIKRQVTIPATAPLVTPTVEASMIERIADDLVGFEFPNTTELWFSSDGYNNRASRLHWLAANLINPLEVMFNRNNIPSVRGNMPKSVVGYQGYSEQNAQSDVALDPQCGFWFADERPQSVASQAGVVEPTAGNAPGDYVVLPMTIKGILERRGKQFMQQGILFASTTQSNKSVKFSYTRHDRGIAPAVGALYPAGTTQEPLIEIELWATIEESRNMPDNKDAVFIGDPYYYGENAVPAGGKEDIDTKPKYVFRGVLPRFDAALQDTGRLAGTTFYTRYNPHVFPSWWATDTKLRFLEAFDGGDLVQTFPEDTQDERAYQVDGLWNVQCRSERGRALFPFASELLTPPIGESAPVFVSGDAVGTVTTDATTFDAVNRGNLDIANMLGRFSAHPAYVWCFIGLGLDALPGIAINGAGISCPSRFQFEGLTFPDTKLTYIRVRPDLRNPIAAMSKCAAQCGPDGQVVDPLGGVPNPDSPKARTVTDYTGALVNVAMVQDGKATE